MRVLVIVLAVVWVIYVVGLATFVYTLLYPEAARGDKP